MIQKEAEVDCELTEQAALIKYHPMEVRYQTVAISPTGRELNVQGGQCNEDFNNRVPVRGVKFETQKAPFQCSTSPLPPTVPYPSPTIRLTYRQAFKIATRFRDSPCA